MFLGLPLFAQNRDWEAEFKKLREYDSKFASRLRNSDGSWVKPKKEIALLLETLKDQIDQAATKMKVDRRAIVGAILAENTMNVGISDGAQEWLVKVGLASKGKVLGKSFTFGLGQLDFKAAREAENYAAKIQGRKPLSDNDLEAQLLDPGGSVLQVAQVIRKVQDDYKKYGFDISGKPEILTTLYNLGQSEQRAKEAKEQNRSPRPNYFGFFVAKNMSAIETIAQPKRVMASTQAAAPVAPSAPVKTNPTAPQVKLVKRTVLDRSLSLTQSPPICGKEEYGNDPIRRYEGFKAFPSLGVAEKGTGYSKLAPGLDCDSNVWSLIKTDSGVVGWVMNTDLEKASRVEWTPPLVCSYATNEKCKASVGKEIQTELAKDVSASKLLYVHPKTAKGFKPGFKIKDPICGQDQYQQQGNGQLQGQMPMQQNPTLKSAEEGGPRPNTIDELIRLEKRLSQIVSRVSQLSENDSPLPMLLDHMQQAHSATKSCVARQQADFGSCDVDAKKLDGVMTELERLVNQPETNIQDYSTVRTLVSQVLEEGYKNAYSGVRVRPWAASRSEINELSFDSAVKGMNACKRVLSELNSQAYRRWPAGQFLDSFDQIKRESFKDENAQAAAHWIKLCSAASELFLGKELVAGSEDPSLQALCKSRYRDNILIDQFKSIKRKYINQTMSSMDRDFFLAGEAMLIPAPQIAGGSQVNPISPRFEDLGSFCPNLTADWIEETLKKFPCVKRVYLPEHWLLARLNSLGDKVVYRPFERDDVFAFDFTEVKCK